MSAILITGFEPFGPHAENPSAELARELAKAPGRAAAVLPVSYARAGDLVRALLEQHQPRTWLVLGLCADARGLRLERTARNLDTSPQPDADGRVRCGVAIDASGPDSYPSSLPLAAFASRLELAGVTVEWSDDAGGFLCNHVFYRVHDALAAQPRGTACGLIHVPPASVLRLERQREALESCLELIA